MLNVWLKRISSVLTKFCVLVTLCLGLVFALNPRGWLDFVQVLYLVRKDFQEPISAGVMIDGAVAGLAEAAEDPYTYYLPPERNKAAAMSARGITGAIGITVAGEKAEGETLVIREVRPDSGADRAGLRAGDAILEIEDEPVEPLTVSDCVARIQGEPGTAVRLLVAREGEADREYSVTRLSTVPLETVQSGFLKEDYLEEYLPGGQVAYLYLDYFASNSGDQFDEKLDALLEEGAQALILDLRYNGGGDVQAAAQIAGRLLPDGELMRLDMRETEVYYRVEEARPIDIPYVILVNSGSASASEILAGAVRDRQGGALVGTRTYGKGSVQSLYQLPTGSGLRVTEGKYYLPGGDCIDGEGIEPDYTVENDPESEEDAQLKKAVELLAALLQEKRNP